MTAKVTTAGKGRDGLFPMTVTVRVTAGIGIHYTGMRDEQIKTHLLRTATAIQALGHHIPGRKILVDISAEEQTQDASLLDLPVALAILSASGQADLPSLDRYLVAGELGLDGSVRDTGDSPGLEALAASLNLCGCITAQSTGGNFTKALGLLSEDRRMPLQNKLQMRGDLIRNISAEIVRLHVKSDGIQPDGLYSFPVSILECAVRFTNADGDDIHLITGYDTTSDGQVFFTDEKSRRHPCEDFADDVLMSVLMMLTSIPQQPSSGRRQTFLQKIRALGDWKPQHAWHTNPQEIKMLQTHFDMEETDETDLRNLRDMVVLFYSRKGHDLDVINTLNSITSVIDHTLASRGIMP